MAPFFRRLHVVASLGVLSLSTFAEAQDTATAKQLFDSGLSDMQAGRYETGCKAIAQSLGLDPRPGTLFTLATCEAQWGRIATAVERYGDYLKLFERLPEDRKSAQGERARVAAEQQVRLAPDVPKLTLSLPKGAPAGTVVRRDGVSVTETALGVAMSVDPGEHTLSTQAPGGPVWEQRIRLAKGEKKEVTLEVKPALEGQPSVPKVSSTTPPASSDTPSQNAGPGSRRAATYVIGGAGVVGVIAGGILGGLALGQKGTMDQHCGAGLGRSDDTSCDATGLEAVNNIRAFGLGSNVLLPIGAVALGVALVLFLTEPNAVGRAAGKHSAWVSPGASVGPTGATLHLRGAW